MSSFFTVGQIIVSKVFVGHSMPLKVGDTCDRSSHHTLCSVYRNMDAKNKTTPSDGMKEINLRKKYTFLLLITSTNHFCLFIQKELPPTQRPPLSPAADGGSGSCLIGN